MLRFSINADSFLCIQVTFSLPESGFFRRLLQHAGIYDVFFW